MFYQTKTSFRKLDSQNVRKAGFVTSSDKVYRLNRKIALKTILELYIKDGAFMDITETAMSGFHHF